tara:strand:+ start:749 stop:1477 length:729 start_codon:yes stop_codon:yes gene_type:complete
MGLGEVAFSQGSNQAYQSANQDFEAEKFEEAAVKYDELVKMGLISSELFYNLGTTRFRQGREGEAILWMRRAVMADPGMPEAFQNLEFFRTRHGFLEFSESRLDRLLRDFPHGLGRWLASFCIWGGLLAIAGAFLSQRLGPNRSSLITVGVILLMFSFVGFRLQSYQETNVNHENFATVVSNEAIALTAPNPNAKTVIELPPGSEIRILQNSGTWCYADIPGELRGWIRSENLESNWPIATN